MEMAVNTTPAKAMTGTKGSIALDNLIFLNMLMRADSGSPRIADRRGLAILNAVFDWRFAA
jgi:hypothetical protein